MKLKILNSVHLVLINETCISDESGVQFFDFEMFIFTIATSIKTNSIRKYSINKITTFISLLGATRKYSFAPNPDCN